MEQIEGIDFLDLDHINENLDVLTTTLQECDPDAIASFLEGNEYILPLELFEVYKLDDLDDDIVKSLCRLIVVLGDLGGQGVFRRIVSLEGNISGAVTVLDVGNVTDETIFYHRILLLCNLLSCVNNGEEWSMPRSDVDSLNIQFVNSLMDQVDELRYSDERVLMTLVSLIVNIQAHVVRAGIEDRYVLETCLGHDNARVFSEMFINLLNRGSSQEFLSIPNALDFLVDIFSDQDLTQFFYTNDMAVLVDVLIRDLHESAELRPQYLAVLYVILATEFYKDKRYRANDVYDLLENMLDEEEIDSKSKSCAEHILYKHQEVLHNPPN